MGRQCHVADLPHCNKKCWPQIESHFVTHTRSTAGKHFSDGSMFVKSKKKLAYRLPSGVEVSEGVGDVAGHADNNGPFAAQVFDHDGRQEHGGDDDGGVDDAQRRHTHPLLCI